MKEIRIALLAVLVLCVAAVLFYVMYPKYYFTEIKYGLIRYRCNRITGKVESLESGKFESIEKPVRTFTEDELTSAKSEDLSFLPVKAELSFWDRLKRYFLSAKPQKINPEPVKDSFVPDKQQCNPPKTSDKEKNPFDDVIPDKPKDK